VSWEAACSSTINVTSGCNCKAEAETADATDLQWILQRSSRLGRARGEQNTFPRFQNRSYAHSDRATRAFLARRKRFRVIVNRFLAKDFQPRARRQAGSRLVEADVSVAPDPKDLQVDPSHFADGLLIGTHNIDRNCPGWFRPGYEYSVDSH